MLAEIHNAYIGTKRKLMFESPDPAGADEEDLGFRAK